MQFYRLKINKIKPIYDVITPQGMICQSKTSAEVLSCALKRNISFVCFQFFVMLSISVTTTNLRKANKKRKLQDYASLNDFLFTILIIRFCFCFQNYNFFVDFVA